MNIKKFYRFFSAIILILLIREINAQNGIVRTYYSKHKIESEISYVNDIYDGTSYWYYENGYLKEEKTYDNGKLNGWVRKYYSTGLPNEEFYVKDGVLDGIAKSYYENGGLKEVKIYDKGKLIKSDFVQYDKSFIPPFSAYTGSRRNNEKIKTMDEYLCDVKICAEPLGGMESVIKNLVYPKLAKLYGLEGIVTLVATVTEMGNVSATSIVKGIGLGCDEAAEIAVKKTRFIPGQDDRGVVESNVTINVEFRLNKKEDVRGKAGKDSTNNIVIFDCDLDECPSPIGGADAILNNLKIPKIMIDKNISGKIVIRAHIDNLGNVRSTKIIKSLGYGSDKAVQNAIINTRFYPGKSDGESKESDLIIIVPINEQPG